MTDKRKYYEAYDDRYRQVHKESLQWFTDAHSQIVSDVMDEFGVLKTASILEIGCGEGRDAKYLLKQGYDLLATDISKEAISFCKRTYPEKADRFQTLDCINGSLDGKFDFIYAVAVVHMLVLDADREAFYRFIYEHLNDSGIALICTMGDGEFERKSDIKTAFELQERTHEQSGKELKIAGTSCRMVSFETFRNELYQNSFEILKEGITSIEPEFTHMMYAVVRRK